MNRHVVKHVRNSETFYEVRCDSCKSNLDFKAVGHTRAEAWSVWDFAQESKVPIVADSIPEEMIEFAKNEIKRISEWLDRVSQYWDLSEEDSHNMIVEDHKKFYRKQEMLRDILVDWVAVRM